MIDERTSIALRFNLNGRSVETQYEAQESLAELLRNRLNLIGKIGAGTHRQPVYQHGAGTTDLHFA